ncbi:mitochondrial resolvase Ydc2 [Pseudomassariella vexata]|uniref:Mitochondrial resolvase Ydc2 n=1 Tax=Pseudomassariella vexata TaxID=1141098 RepID=A0A1Y2DZ07_9PEZI|nr:mitochondrial resolvase Ydc2 [Pseudomassariella vexata]ORY64336.1 mitochondrial resolvase Ydc2 [Pseudomassariella vexata]
MALRLPPLKQAQLKTLALACGLPLTGTKGVLIDYLLQACERQAHDKEHSILNKRVLSIDLGLRNLAFSLLHPLDQTSSAEIKKNGYDFRRPPRAQLETWSRFSIVPAQLATPLETKNYDAWSPAKLSQLTFGLVKDQLLTLKPTHILIERQRFRSGSMAAVQEWTLRVNTLEAMMHAVLRTLYEEKLWTGEVLSIPPARVGPFWLSDEGQGEKPVSKKSTKVRNKQAKIDLVGKWLEQEDIKVMEGARSTSRGFMNRWLNNPIELGMDEKLDKLDDLADCLLQGLAWIKWEQNRLVLTSHGPIVLLNQM